MNNNTHKFKVFVYSLLSTFLSITLIVTLEAQRGGFQLEALPFI